MTRRAVVAVVVAVLALAAPAAAPAATVTWDRGANTNSWHDANNWSTNALPAPGDLVVIPTGFATVTHSQAITTQIGGIDLRSPLTVSGGGTLRLDGTHPSTTSAQLTVSGATLDNDGPLTSTAGNTTVTGTGVLDNSGTFTFASDGDLVTGGGTPQFRNTGTFRKSAGTTQTVVSVPFDIDGVLDVQTGTVQLTGGGLAGNEQSGAFQVVSGAVLEFGSNITLGAAASVTGAGELRQSSGTVASSALYDPARTNLTGGTLTLAGPSETGTLIVSNGTLNANDGLGPSSLALSGGTLNANAALTPSSVTHSNGTLGGSALVTAASYAWTAGTQSGAGTTRVTGTLSMAGVGSKISSRRLELPAGATATLAGTGNLAIGAPGVFANDGTFDAQSDADVTSNGGTPQFLNDGTFVKSAGSGETSVTLPFDNDGTLRVTAGSVRMTAGGLTSDDQAGSFEGSPGTALDFGGGTFTLAPTATVTADLVRATGATVTSGAAFDATSVAVSGGTLTLNGASDADALTVSGGTLNANDALSPVSVSQPGGTLGGSATVVTHAYAWTSGTQSGTGTTRVTGSLTLPGTLTKTLNRRLELPAGNTATLSGTGNLAIGAPGVLDNRGTFEVQSDADVVSNGGTPAPQFLNDGTFAKTAGSGETAITVLLDNDGTVRAATGTLRMTAGGLTGDDQTGPFEASAGTVLDFGGGTFSLAASADVSGDAVRASGAAVTSGGAFDANNLAVSGGTLTLNGASDLGTLTLSGGTLNANDALDPASVSQPGGILGGSAAVVTPTYAWSGGSQTGSGTTRVTASLTLTGTVSKTLLRRLEVPAGASATQSGTGNLAVGASGVVDNQGTFEVQSDADVVSSGGTPAPQFVNDGTFRKSAGAAETLVGIAIDNDGLLDVGAGSVRLTAGGLTGDEQIGHFRTGAGTVLDFAGGTFLLAAGARVSGPEARFSGATVTSAADYDVDLTRVSGGTLTLDGPTAARSVVLSAGTLASNVALALDSVQHTGGTMSGSAPLMVASYAWSGGTQAGGGMTRISGSLSMSGASTKVLSRRLEVPAAATAALSGTGNLAVTSEFVNYGTFDVQSDADVVSNGGTPMLRNNGTFRKSGGTAETVIGIALDNQGTLRAQAGTLNVTGTFVNYNATTDVLTGGRFEVVATLKFTGADLVTNAAGLVLDGSSARVVDGASANGLRNFAWNAAAGVLEVVNGHALVPPRRFNNAGTVTVGDGSSITPRDYVQTGGTTTLVGAASLFDPVLDLVRLNGGVLQGVGTVEGDVVNAGEVRPGSSSGTLTIDGDYAQSASGRLTVDVEDPAHDLLAVTGTVALGGILEIVTIGAGPAEEARFPVVSHAAASGRFAGFVGREIGGGLHYNPEYGTGETALVVGPLAPVRLSVSDVTVAESDTDDVQASFTVTSSEPREGVGFDYGTVDGTATAPGDYEPVSGSVAFAPDQTSAKVVVPVRGDVLYEQAEEFRLELSNVQGAVVLDGSGRGTIRDNDTAPSAAITDVTVTEGDGVAVPATFELTLSEAAGTPVAVAWRTLAGTARAGQDYVAASGSTSFAPGETSKTVTVDVVGDRADEPTERFFLDLTSGVGVRLPDGEGEATILDEDDTCESLAGETLATDPVCALVAGS